MLGLRFGLVETDELKEHKLQLEVSLGTRTEHGPAWGLGLLGDTGWEEKILGLRFG